MRWRRGPLPESGQTDRIDNYRHSSPVHGTPTTARFGDIDRDVPMRVFPGVNMGSMTSDSNQIADAITAWKQWQAVTCCENTVRQRMDTLERLREHVARQLGATYDDVDPMRITTEQVARYLSRTLSANSRNVYYRNLRSWFGWLHKTGRIDHDPMIDIAMPRGTKGIPRPLTMNEVAKAFEGADQQLRAMMALALFEGLRAHEVAAFRGDQIRDEQIVLVGKGGRPARLPLASQMMEIVAEMPTQGWWFPSRYPGRDHIRPEWVSKVVGDRLRKIGIAKGAIHRFRHTFGTEVYGSSGNIVATRELLRHESIQTTMIYVDVDRATLRKALDGLPRLTA